MNLIYSTIIIFIIGCIFIISGPITYIILTENIMQNLQKNYIITSSNSKNFDYIDNYNILFYIYNLTNPVNTINGEQPILEVIGPYDYTLSLITSDYSFSENKEIFTFKRDYYYSANTTKNIDSLVNSATQLQIPYINVANLVGSERIIPYGKNNYHFNI